MGFGQGGEVAALWFGKVQGLQARFDPGPKTMSSGVFPWCPCLLPSISQHCLPLCGFSVRQSVPTVQDHPRFHPPSSGGSGESSCYSSEIPEKL